ncbi:MAG: twin-arginine translocase subunit TatC [Negativicutes bacterium]|nr:twin-arginine translocase subunit TatC [Negativicutes bacterium]
MMDDKRQSLVEHLAELRQVIIASLAALALASLIGFWLAPGVMAIIVKPLPSAELVFFGPFDGFYLQIRLAVVIGFVLAFPAIVASWASFLSPGMTRTEKKAALYGGIAAILLFLAGAAYALRIVLPLVLSFLLTFSTPEMLPVVAGDEYLTFVLSFLVYSGLFFTLPLAVWLMVYFDILSPGLIQRHRRWCLAVLLSLALFFSPGSDLVTQALLALPLYLLFEAAILTARYFKNRLIKIRGDCHVGRIMDNNGERPA